MARQYGRQEMCDIATELAQQYKGLLIAHENEPDILQKAHRIRRKLEASEQYRTMCVEHGLNDSAIDVTYEIQELESKLIALVQEHFKS